MSWYRQYRPTSIAHLHLESVRVQLLDLMERGRIPHALLFAGPKGTGKTSAARIISAMLNDPRNADVVKQLFAVAGGEKPLSPKKTPLLEPDLTNDVVGRIFRGASLVVHELDAASNRGIDDIRSLKEQVYLPPSEGEVSVYILDEVHMLTTEAFNALLKILEEPPPQVMFILATTELHKLPETIVSRCRLIRFQRASTEELKAALLRILEQEKIEAEEAVLDQIAKAADGSFRDGVKLLETIAAGKKKVSLSDLEMVIPSVAVEEIWQFIEAIPAADDAKVFAVIDRLRQQGSDPVFFHASMVEVLYQEWRMILSGKESIHFSVFPAARKSAVAQFLLQQFSGLNVSRQAVLPFLELELKAVELITKAKEKKKQGEPPLGGRSSSSESSPSQTSGTVLKTSTTKADEVKSLEILPSASEVRESHTSAPMTNTIWPPAETIVNVIPVKDSQEFIQHWEEFLHAVHARNSTLAALLRSAKPVMSQPGMITIEVYYRFHCEQLQQPKFLRLIEEAIQQIMGGMVQLSFAVVTPPTPAHAALETGTDTQLADLAKELLV